MAKDSQLDETDLKIVRLLLEDARKSSREIAREMKITHQTVIARLKKLEENKVVRGYTAVVDWQRIGYPIKTFFLIETGKMEEETLNKIEAYLNKDASFTSAGTLSGDYDLYVVGKFRDQEEALRKTTALRAFLGKAADLRIFRTYQVWRMLKEIQPSISK